MKDHNYQRTISNHFVFIKIFAEGDYIILLLYVDDKLIIGQDKDQIANLKKVMNKFFAMKDLGPAKQIFGMKISRDRSNKKLWLSQ